MSEMAEAIRELIETKGFSEDSVRQTIENAIKAAYKRTFGTADNCIVKFADDMSDVTVYSRKTIVDGVYDPVIEMELEEAREKMELQVNQSNLRKVMKLIFRLTPTHSTALQFLQENRLPIRD